MSCLRLAGLWARYDVPLLDAHARIDLLFNSVFPGDRDSRWRAKYDALRVVADIYRKHRTTTGEATEAEAETEPPPAAASGPAWPEPLGPEAISWHRRRDPHRAGATHRGRPGGDAVSVSRGCRLLPRQRQLLFRRGQPPSPIRLS